MLYYTLTTAILLLTNWLVSNSLTIAFSTVGLAAEILAHFCCITTDNLAGVKLPKIAFSTVGLAVLLLPHFWKNWLVFYSLLNSVYQRGTGLCRTVLLLLYYQRSTGKCRTIILLISTKELAGISLSYCCSFTTEDVAC